MVSRNTDVYDLWLGSLHRMFNYADRSLPRMRSPRQWRYARSNTGRRMRLREWAPAGGSIRPEKEQVGTCERRALDMRGPSNVFHIWSKGRNGAAFPSRY